MIEYKKMDLSHIKEVAQIEGLCFPNRFGEKTFLRELDNKIAYYIVAISHGKVAGYGGLWNICGEADITDIATHPDFRRMGIGEGILDELIKYCKENKITKINLEVRESNIPAQKLYEKLGFIYDGQRKNYYENRETAILMSLNL
ncbi:MAG: ribosomal-protein-alanine N-acetyltransferase [Ruminococcaceae bacterium]|nr:ribosomal-protein-alanine N-acetyltransferase [Oscillospiraceae bacterium]